MLADGAKLLGDGDAIDVLIEESEQEALATAIEDLECFDANLMVDFRESCLSDTVDVE